MQDLISKEKSKETCVDTRIAQESPSPSSVLDIVLQDQYINQSYIAQSKLLQLDQFVVNIYSITT